MFDCWLLSVACFITFHLSTLYGVTNLVAEVTKLVAHEESLTSDFVGKAERGMSRGGRGDAEKGRRGLK